MKSKIYKFPKNNIKVMSKKITLVLAFIGMITLQSCTVNEDNGNGIDNDTIAEVFEYGNVNFLPNSYSVVLTFPHSIPSSDMVLVYRLSGTFQGEDVWKPLPETYYFADGTLDLRYDYDFTRFDTQINMEGFDLASVSAGYRLNQIFRVVVIPGFFGKNSQVDFNDYNAVIRAYQIDESKIVKVQ
ncbi:hypothetical protein [Flavobacterium sedimenticola]|uniref:Lipoprotein n=2 Tax=Flavobacterium TaxID=237 RepID=A0ABT6XPG5_9FLAO|nr:hypothetical protein [Flavobacterium sedimenticola]MDI9256970.1 hypothetical protein [Flavobacterium sedimenticola]